MTEAAGRLQDQISHSEATLWLSPVRFRTEKVGEVVSSHPELESILQEIGLVVTSASLRFAVERAATAAKAPVPVLLLGETGTGKELFARLVHRLSDRADKPMVTVNCAAIPEDLAESHLFGHTKGAFTGAHAASKGVFGNADAGTVFLDEVGELPLEVQAKLLRVLEQGTFTRLGTASETKVDVRVIAATNRKLEPEVASKSFREDLYFRLNVARVELPPLRRRKAEIPQLAAASRDIGVFIPCGSGLWTSPSTILTTLSN